MYKTIDYILTILLNFGIRKRKGKKKKNYKYIAGDYITLMLLMADSQ